MANDQDDWKREFDPRSDARERALNVLFEADIRGCPASEVVGRIQAPLDDLTLSLVDGVSSSRERIDSVIASHSHSWTLDRMAATDRNILRIATYELMARVDVPSAVILNEAVSLAKRYGTDDSGGFVNGVLAAIARSVRNGKSGNPLPTGGPTD